MYKRRASALLLFGLLACGPVPVSHLSTEDVEMRFFYGNLHSHTSYSDGTGLPRDAFSWARDSVGYDFYAITDHAELLTEVEWQDIGEQATSFTENGRFIALRGFEYTNYLFGHINVFNTETYTSFFKHPSLTGFYRWLGVQDNALASFNHPGSPLFAFRHIEIPDNLKTKMFGMETGNGYNRNISNLFIPLYANNLRYGQYLAPVYNMDNHTFTENGCRTVVLATELTREAILEALRARRVYAADNPEAKVAFKCNGQWMGSRITSEAETIHCTVTASDVRPITQIHIVSSSGEQRRFLFNKEYRASLELDLTVMESTYFYVKVFGKESYRDGPSELMSITAPIWVDKLNSEQIN